MHDLVMFSSMVPDFYAGFWTGTVTDWLLDFSSGICIETEADFTSKQGVLAGVFRALHVSL